MRRQCRSLSAFAIHDGSLEPRESREKVRDLYMDVRNIGLRIDVKDTEFMV